MASFPATLAELTGPWRQAPLVLDPLLWSRAEAACTRDMEMPQGSRAVIIDARGEGVLAMRMTAGGCNSLRLTRDGQIEGAGGGWSMADPTRLVPRLGSDLGPVERQEVGGGDLTVSGWSIYGEAGDAIATVMVEPLGHPPVQATLMNGWFSAWWPALPGERAANGGGLPGEDAPPVVVSGYDALGSLLDVLEN